MSNKKDVIKKEETAPVEEVKIEEDDKLNSDDKPESKKSNDKPKEKKKVIRVVSMTAQEFAKSNNYKKAIAQAIVLLNPSYKEYKSKDVWKDIFEAFLIKPENINWSDWLKQYKRRNG